MPLLEPTIDLGKTHTSGNAAVAQLLGEATHGTGLPDRLKPESRPCPAWRRTLQFDANGARAPI